MEKNKKINNLLSEDVVAALKEIINSCIEVQVKKGTLTPLVNEDGVELPNTWICPSGYTWDITKFYKVGIVGTAASDELFAAALAQGNFEFRFENGLMYFGVNEGSAVYVMDNDGAFITKKYFDTNVGEMLTEWKTAVDTLLANLKSQQSGSGDYSAININLTTNGAIVPFIEENAFAPSGMVTLTDNKFKALVNGEMTFYLQSVIQGMQGVIDVKLYINGNLYGEKSYIVVVGQRLTVPWLNLNVLANDVVHISYARGDTNNGTFTAANTTLTLGFKTYTEVTLPEQMFTSNIIDNSVDPSNALNASLVDMKNQIETNKINSESNAGAITTLEDWVQSPISEDLNNVAVLGTDEKIYVPASNAVGGNVIIKLEATAADQKYIYEDVTGNYYAMSTSITVPKFGLIANLEPIKAAIVSLDLVINANTDHINIIRFGATNVNNKIYRYISDDNRTAEYHIDTALTWKTNGADIDLIVNCALRGVWTNLPRPAMGPTIKFNLPKIVVEIGADQASLITNQGTVALTYQETQRQVPMTYLTDLGTAIIKNGEPVIFKR